MNGPMIPAHMRKILDEESKYYIYRRLRLLKEYGYVNNKNYYEVIEGYKRKVKKMGTLYYLLHPGVIAAKNYLQFDMDKRPRTAEPSKEQLPSYYHLGRIRAALTPHLRNGNKWLPGKLAKQHLQLNTKMRIVSMLKINGRRLAG